MSFIKKAKQMRKKKKKTPKIRRDPFLLPSPDPCKDSVDGAELLAEIVVLVKKYFVVQKGTTTTLALWVLATWVFKEFHIFPYLKISSPVASCGKSSLLKTVGYLSQKAILTEAISPAALFRAVEKWGATVLLDEMDMANLKNDPDMKALLNSGFQEDGKALRAMKTKDGDFEPVPYSTYSPKVLCGIADFLPPTIKSRAISITLKKKTQKEKVGRLRMKLVKAECQSFPPRMRRWAEDNKDTIANHPEPYIPAELSDRDADLCEPLLTVAEVIGGEWPHKARETFLRLCSNVNDEETDDRKLLLVDIQPILETTPKISSVDLVWNLNCLLDRPWSEFSYGRELTPRQLSKMLNPFGISPKALWIDGKTKQGYDRDWFKDTFDRYLPPVTQDTQGSSTDNALSDITHTQEEG